jgi:hypothetical protein
MQYVSKLNPAIGLGIVAFVVNPFFAKKVCALCWYEYGRTLI